MEGVNQVPPLKKGTVACARSETEGKPGGDLLNCTPAVGGDIATRGKSFDPLFRGGIAKRDKSFYPLFRGGIA